MPPGPIELTVVVPAYDEEEVLPLFVERLRPILDGLGTTYEVLVVDDGSRDATPVLLQRARRDWPQLRVAATPGECRPPGRPVRRPGPVPR